MPADLAPAWLLPAIPLLAAALLCLPAARQAAGWTAIAASAASLAVACALPWWPAGDALLLIDPAACLFAGLAAFTGLAAAWTAQWSGGTSWCRHARLLAMLGAVLLALVARPPLLAWLALGGATLAASRTWFVLAAPGLALALAGLLVLGAAPALGFICLLLGYGGLIGLVPLQAGLLRLQTDDPLAALPGFSLSTAALLPLLRLHPALPAGPFLTGFGMLGLLFAGLFLWRADLRRGPALAGMGQLGLAMAGFGLGATAPALWQLAMLALARIAVLVPLGLPEGRARTLTLGAGLLALAGMPPFGLFAGLALILPHAPPWLGAVCALGLAGMGAGLMRLLAGLPAGGRESVANLAAMAPAWLALAALLACGLDGRAGVAGLIAAAGAGLP